MIANKVQFIRLLIKFVNFPYCGFHDLGDPATESLLRKSRKMESSPLYLKNNKFIQSSLDTDVEKW
jgi:hypothetical protein